MPSAQHFEEITNRFKAEMQEYINDGFRATDCFPFVFQNLVESTGIAGTERTELHRALREWTQKIM